MKLSEVDVKRLKHSLAALETELELCRQANAFFSMFQYAGNRLNLRLADLEGEKIKIKSQLTKEADKC